LYHPFEIILPFSNGEFVGYQGLASHGAAVGILVALILYSRNNKIAILWLLDRIGIAVAVSGFFVRLGNLMNSEVYGVETALPWGFIFTGAGETVPKHPTQLYEALSYLLIFVFLYWLYSKKRSVLKPGASFGIFLILLFTVRFLVEFVKEVQVEFEEGLPLDMGQWLSIPFILLGCFMLYMSLRQKWPESFVRSAPTNPNQGKPKKK
jgi:prolipoprotein diacylglyceryl transferase